MKLSSKTEMQVNGLIIGWISLIAWLAMLLFVGCQPTENSIFDAIHKPIISCGIIVFSVINCFAWTVWIYGLYKEKIGLLTSSVICFALDVGFAISLLGFVIFNNSRNIDWQIMSVTCYLSFLLILPTFALVVLIFSVIAIRLFMSMVKNATIIENIQKSELVAIDDCGLSHSHHVCVLAPFHDICTTAHTYTASSNYTSSDFGLSDSTSMDYPATDYGTNDLSK